MANEGTQGILAHGPKNKTYLQLYKAVGVSSETCIYAKQTLSKGPKQDPNVYNQQD